MGRNKKNMRHCQVKKYQLTTDIINLATHFNENDKTEKTEISNNNNKKSHVPKELINSEKRIALTRTYKKYDKSSLYDMAKEISKPNDDGCLYLSKFQVYKHCRNTITKPDDYMHKIDDSCFLSFSRMLLPKEFECYLFSLIHSDIFNFDKDGNFACDQTTKFFSVYSEVQSQLRYSILLDGLLLAIDDIIVNNNSNYHIALGSEIELTNHYGIIINEFDKPLWKLLKKMYPTFAYYSLISEFISLSNTKRKVRYVN